MLLSSHHEVERVVADLDNAKILMGLALGGEEFFIGIRGDKARSTDKLVLRKEDALRVLTGEVARLRTRLGELGVEDDRPEPPKEEHAA